MATQAARSKPKPKPKPQAKQVNARAPKGLTITLSPSACQELEKRAGAMPREKYLTLWLEALLKPKPETPATGINPHLARNLATLEKAYGANSQFEGD